MIRLTEKFFKNISKFKFIWSISSQVIYFLQLYVSKIVFQAGKHEYSRRNAPNDFKFGGNLQREQYCLSSEPRRIICVNNKLII